LESVTSEIYLNTFKNLVMIRTCIVSILLAVGIMACTQKKDNKTTSGCIEFEMAFQDPELSVDERVNDLIGRLNTEEKIGQLLFNSPAIDRLGIPEYNWWNEACHGVARNGQATVFPQPIGMAASFDSSLIFRVADAISTEARAKFNEAQRIGNRGQYAGLTFWAPNVNLFRDPRWGRGMETFGEDPYLTSVLGVSFVKGMQGNDPNSLKTAACAKHYVVHSGPESERHTFNALPSKKDFYETYTPQFKALVQEGNVETVMCAYNRTYNEPCCGSKYLMQDVLRTEFGFKGHIVSDCWAITDFHSGHNTEPDVVHSAAKALKSGVNLNCGNEFPHLKEAYNKGLVTDADLDEALRLLLPTRFKLGLFDPKGSNEYDNISTDVVNSTDHKKLALEAAQKSIVMLKNNNILPLDKNIRKLFIIGPYAASVEVLLGNYYGVSSTMTTFMEGIVGKVSAGTSIDYRPGTLPDHASANTLDWAGDEAMACDAIVAVFGISNMFEGEEGETLSSTSKGDRIDLGLPEHQLAYLKKLRAKGSKPIILILTGGSPISSPEVFELADAVLFAWYPGQEGGQAAADIIFGDINPSGRLPITFPKTTSQLPTYSDYSMKGRTYRYMNEEPQYPFGFGLSYTTFNYSDIKASKNQINSGESITVAAKITNTGKFAGEEVAQLYISDNNASVVVPNSSLKGFKRIQLAPGESTEVTFSITPEMLKITDNEGKAILEPGEFTIVISGSSPMPISGKLGISSVGTKITVQ
jgi:beta-glucosidase